ncbi:hypothetical protein C8F04DRAFT_1267962 [Mycena alexandri]|uniref:Uncharacterized protein n=1 Tax=Mycena alexandri TaxID=1745969 RepID=A0AAD6SFC3_9AGAR|nr:hypothetical protein C8F04DRAFT_1267962 [Mycena alexandri]
MPAPGQPRCEAPFYPSPHPGHANTSIHDGKKDARYFVVGEGRGCGIFTDVDAANRQTDGYSSPVKRSCKKWDTAVLLWNEMCDELHHQGCPPRRVPVGFAAPTTVKRVAAAPPPGPTSTPAVPVALAPTQNAGIPPPSPSAAAPPPTQNTVASPAPIPNFFSSPSASPIQTMAPGPPTLFSPAPAPIPFPPPPPFGSTPVTPTRQAEPWETGAAWTGWESPNVKLSVSPSPLRPALVPHPSIPRLPLAPPPLAPPPICHPTSAAASTAPRPRVTANTRIMLTSRRDEYEGWKRERTAQATSSSESTLTLGSMSSTSSTLGSHDGDEDDDNDDPVLPVFYAVQGITDQIFGDLDRAMRLLPRSSIPRPSIMESTDIAKLWEFARQR